MGDKTADNILHHIQTLRRKDQGVPLGAESNNLSDGSLIVRRRLKVRSPFNNYCSSSYRERKSQILISKPR